MRVSALVTEIFLGLSDNSRKVGSRREGMLWKGGDRWPGAVIQLSAKTQLTDIPLHLVSAMLSDLITVLHSVEYTDHSGKTVRGFKELKNHCVNSPLSLVLGGNFIPSVLVLVYLSLFLPPFLAQFTLSDALMHRSLTCACV